MNIPAEEAWLNRTCIQLAELAPQLTLVSASLDQATRRVLMHAHVRASGQTDHTEQRVDTQHLLLGIYDEGENAGTQVLRALGYDAPAVQRTLQEFQGQMDSSSENDGFLTRLSIKALALAWEEMTYEQYANGLSPAFLVLGLWRVGDGAAGLTLAKLGKSYAKAQALVRLVSGLTSE